MRFLVTGAAGFIGSHVANKLLREGNEVVCVDNFDDYYSIDLKKERVQNLLEPLGVEIHNLDLQNSKQVKELFEENHFDSVIHLAAQAGVRLKLDEYGKYSVSNLMAFSNVLVETISQQIPNFIYASSSSVYGNSEEEILSESDKSIVPISFYGATKLSNEILASAAVTNTSTRARGLRFFTVYGPWGRPDMAYFRIIASAYGKYDFIKFGDGSVTRDFTYIEDVVDCVYNLNIELLERSPGFADVVNIGGGTPSSLNEMIKIIGDLTNAESSKVIGKMHPQDVNRTHASTEYLGKLIPLPSFQPLTLGLSKVVEWAQNSKVTNQISLWCNSVD